MSEQLTLDSRAFQFYSSMAVHDVTSALVELITNADDAHRKAVHLGKKASTQTRNIAISISNFSLLVVRDDALGLKAADMERCFLTAGKYTAWDGARGYFSTGAKHICNLGNVYFESIHDGLYSRALLGHRASVARMEVSDQPADRSHRNSTGIEENGLLVRIYLQPEYYLQHMDLEFCNSIARQYSLRDICANPVNNIIVRAHSREDTLAQTNNQIVIENWAQWNPIWTHRLTYSPPAAQSSTPELILDFTVPNYPEARAQFIIHRTQTPIPEPTSENELQFGFLIETNSTLVAVTCLQERFRQHVSMPHFFGRIRCEYIHTLMTQLDEITERQANGTATEADAAALLKNPFTVVDPLRTRGVNVDHPFIKQLFLIPIDRLDFLLRESTLNNSNKVFVSGSISDVIAGLEAFGKRLIEQDQYLSRWLTQEYGDLLQGIRDFEASYVNVEIDQSGQLRRFRSPITETPEETITEVFKVTSGSSGANINVNANGILENIPTDEYGNPLHDFIINDDDLLSHLHLEEPMFSVEFDNTPNPLHRYTIFPSGSRIILYIYLQHPIIRLHFMKEPDSGELLLLQGEEGVQIVIGIITEAFAWAMARSRLEQRPDAFVALKSGPAMQQAFNAYDQAHNEISHGLYLATEIRKTILFENSPALHKVITTQEEAYEFYKSRIGST